MNTPSYLITHECFISSNLTCTYLILSCLPHKLLFPSHLIHKCPVSSHLAHQLLKSSHSTNISSLSQISYFISSHPLTSHHISSCPQTPHLTHKCLISSLPWIPYLILSHLFCKHIILPWIFCLISSHLTQKHLISTNSFYLHLEIGTFHIGPNTVPTPGTLEIGTSTQQHQFLVLLCINVDFFNNKTFKYFDLTYLCLNL